MSYEAPTQDELMQLAINRVTAHACSLPQVQGYRDVRLMPPKKDQPNDYTIVFSEHWPNEDRPEVIATKDILLRSGLCEAIVESTDHGKCVLQLSGFGKGKTIEDINAAIGNAIDHKVEVEESIRVSQFAMNPFEKSGSVSIPMQGTAVRDAYRNPYPNSKVFGISPSRTNPIKQLTNTLSGIANLG